MRFIDGFAGVGGFRIPLEKLGHKCVWSCENDRYARQVYGYHWDGDIAGDIRKVGTKRIPDFDLFVAGFPCQAFSIAGKRKGFTDTRGTLFFEICRILRDKRPEMVLLENVKGLLSHDHYRTFRIILESLRDLGYMGRYQVLNSKNFGVCQNRERVFIVGYLGDGPRPEVFPIEENGKLSEKKNGTKRRQAQTQNVSSLRSADYQMKADNNYIVHNLQQRSSKRPSLNDNPNAGGQGHIQKNDGSTYCLEQSGKQAIEYAIQTKTMDNLEIRRLTPLEYERLQGFPDHWTKWGINEKGEKVLISDSQRYRMMGNAVTVPVVEAIARKF